MAAPWQVECAGRRPERCPGTLLSTPKESGRRPGVGTGSVCCVRLEERGLLGRCELDGRGGAGVLGNLGNDNSCCH